MIYFKSNNVVGQPLCRVNKEELLPLSGYNKDSSAECIGASELLADSISGDSVKYCERLLEKQKVWY